MYQEKSGNPGANEEGRRERWAKKEFFFVSSRVTGLSDFSSFGRLFTLDLF
jgi:hypothetical protein